MQKLLEALTDLAIEATTYYRRLNNPVLTVAAVAAPAPAAEAAPKLSADVGPAAAPAAAPKKSHKKKDAAVAPPAATTPPAPAAPVVPPAGLGIGDTVAALPPASAPTMSEAESLAELYKAAAAYIQKTPEPEKMAARQAYAKAHMTERYKVESVKDVPHLGRIEFIAWLKDAPTELKTAVAA